MIIEDPRTGQTWTINEDGSGLIFCTTEVVSRHQNRSEQKCWSLPFDAIDPVGADDYFIYLENTGTKTFAVPSIKVRSTVAGTVEVHRVSGTPSYTAGSDITPVNRFLGNTRAPVDLTVRTDTNTTGLTNEGVLDYIRCAAVNTDYVSDIEGDLFLPPGQALALLWDTSTGALSGILTLVQVSDQRIG